MSGTGNKLTYLALLITILVWGLSFIATKIALISFPPVIYMFLRFSLASVLFFFILLKRGIPQLSADEHKKLFLLAFFEPGLYYFFEATGLVYTTASKASIIISTVPIAVILLARIVLKEKISRQNLLGILISITGVCLLVLGDPNFSWSLQGSLLGDILVSGAIVSAAFYMVITRHLGQILDSLVITSYQMFYGTLIFAPVFLVQYSSLNWTQIYLPSLAAILFLALFPTVIGYWSYNYALTQIPASKAGVFLNGVPLVTALGAWLILGEKLVAMQILGGIIAIAGVIIANLEDIKNFSYRHSTSYIKN
ncbi:EamA-like transporter family protein [Thermosyntropha lipolytica DSM 11003]|uniref:EamA-like transporter family protein n=1 Tax=Thermosyntropha lipolytica DSM 11003 TaxID=1123382 RepID=A0A1M5L9M4_9FIRM|nr:EamA family transporter [Thermosyntropha lipolytica]SHG61660.1 EamA-like transporter family protein [Thermosyntropha lipolytica DSM 11003]